MVCDTESLFCLAGNALTVVVAAWTFEGTSVGWNSWLRLIGMGGTVAPGSCPCTATFCSGAVTMALSACGVYIHLQCMQRYRCKPDLVFPALIWRVVASQSGQVIMALAPFPYLWTHHDGSL